MSERAPELDPQAIAEHQTAPSTIQSEAGKAALGRLVEFDGSDPYVAYGATAEEQAKELRMATMNKWAETAGKIAEDKAKIHSRALQRERKVESSKEIDPFTHQRNHESFVEMLRNNSVYPAMIGGSSSIGEEVTRADFKEDGLIEIKQARNTDNIDARHGGEFLGISYLPSPKDTKK